jgi:hypothetical protein
MSRKQLKRKKLHREKGEAISDRYSKKAQRDLLKLERKQTAKELW